MSELVPIIEDHPWMNRVTAVVDEAHAENLGGEHREGFCKACAAAYLVAQRAVPRTPVDALSHQPVEQITEEQLSAAAVLLQAHFRHKSLAACRALAGRILEAARGAPSREIPAEEATKFQLALDPNLTVRLSPEQSEEARALDVALGLTRLITTSEQRHSLDEVLDRFGYTREDLAQPARVTVLESPETGRRWGVSIDTTGGQEHVSVTELEPRETN